MKGMYVRYSSLGSGDIINRISGFSFDGGPWKDAHCNEAGEGRIYLLKCKCGSNDWQDNGRHINELECNSCSQFVQIAYST